MPGYNPFEYTEEFNQQFDAIWNNPALSESEKREQSKTLIEASKKTRMEKYSEQVRSDKAAGGYNLSLKKELQTKARTEIDNYLTTLPQDISPENKALLLAKKTLDVAKKYHVDINKLKEPVIQPISQPTQPVINEPTQVMPIIPTPQYSGLGGIQRRLRKQTAENVKKMEQLYSGMATETETQTEILESAREIGAQKAQSESAYQEEILRIAKEKQAANEELEKRRQEKMEPLEKELMKTISEIKTHKVDPARFFKNTNAVQGIFTVIGAALMNFGAALGGNFSMPGLNFINQIIDRDIQAQKADLESKKTSVAAQQSLLSRMRQTFADEQAAMLATKSIQQEVAVAQLEKMRAKTGNAEFNNRIDQIKSQLNMEAQKNMLSAWQSQNQIVTQGLQAEAQIAAQREALRMQKMAVQGKAQASSVKQRKEMAELTIPGMRFSGETMPSKKDAEEVKKTKINVNETLNIISELKKKVQEYGTELLPTSEAKAARALAEQLRLKLKDVYGLGVLSGSDLDLLYNIVPEDPTGFRTSAFLGNLDTVEKMVKMNYVDAVKTRGYIDNEIGAAERLVFE